MTDEEQTKERVRKFFDEWMKKIDIVIVPDSKEPSNLNKSMVYFIKEPDPYEGLFIYKF